MEKKRNWRPALICILAMTLICGLMYPIVMTGISQLLFPKKANGSQIVVSINGKDTLVGSELLGQQWTKPEYVIGRPTPGAPTNQSAVSDEQKELVEERIAWWHTFDSDTIGKQIPTDLLTVSGSGVDPDISVEAAQFQVSRIAKQRNIKDKEVLSIIEDHTKEKTLGFLGEERVNVLGVNIALDARYPLR